MTETPDDGFSVDVFFCPECGRPFTKLGDKLRHMAEFHPDRPLSEGDELPAKGSK